MTDRDHNRSNNSGTGAKTLDRDDDEGVPTPSQSGSGGGQIQQAVGSRDDVQAASDEAGIAGEPQPTSVKKSDHPDGGDMPNLPNRDGGGEDSRVPPRRT